MEAALVAQFAGNRAAEGRTDYYGVSVLRISPDGAEIRLRLTFRRSEAYCCAEPGCHASHFGRAWWRRLRENLRAQGLGERPPLRIEVEGIVEEGARIPEPSEAYAFEDTWTEVGTSG